MIQKALFLIPARCRYDTLRVFTHQVEAAFQRQGIETRAIDLAEVQFTDVVKEARDLNADVTCCFNGVLPNEQRGFLCEFLDIPHIAWIVDPPYEFLPLKDSPYNLIGCVDASYCQLYKALGCDNAIFLPHGCEGSIADNEEKTFEVALIGTCLDSRKQEEQWKELLPDEVVKLLYRASEQVFTDHCTTPLEALCELSGHSLAELETATIADISLMQLWVQLERYLRGRDRLELVDTIDNAELHIFGRDWDVAFPNPKPNVHIHPPIDYLQAMEVMAKSKIVINSVPVFKHGGHERIFTAPCRGAAVLANDSHYIRNHFEPGVDILTYSLADKSRVNAILRDYLDDEAKRSGLVTVAREKILASHTWDQRVKALLRYFP